MWRGVGLLSASLILSLTTLAPAAAAPAKKAKAAAPSKSTAAKPASKQVAAKATSGKAAKTAPQVAAKGKAAKADVQEAKASKRDRGGKSAKRAFAEERRGGKTNVARGSDRVQRTLSARGKANERAERMAARETRLAIRTVAHLPQEARPARLSFGQLAGLRGVEDPLELKSSVALVLDQDTHEVLLSKNDHAVLPIASLTKLMTGLIVSDARLPLDEMISITEDDIDYEKGSRSRLPVGTTLTRGELMHLALMSSENRAAHALGRTFPGGMQRFVGLMNARAMMLGMKDTRYVEPTGLSSENRSSAYDLATLVNTAAQDPLLRQLSTSQGYEVAVGNRVLQYNNTNRLVHNPDWQIGLQKTGYISEAGQCLVMQARVAGRKLIMVFLDSSGKYSRLADAERVRRWVEFERAPTNTAASNPYAS
ncbi:MAG TPA: serine hydrolase [Ottowia sp.]|uniref:serine hydrolase n=1 Tax=Ottowia sp. TaxID=1898956 RepID=UPI002CF145E4|nr:serine hydrolase [Ottowia sp.]HRN08627.1 serine hydrolase [Ottowia sp.]